MTDATSPRRRASTRRRAPDTRRRPQFVVKLSTGDRSPVEQLADLLLLGTEKSLAAAVRIAIHRTLRDLRDLRDAKGLDALLAERDRELFFLRDRAALAAAGGKKRKRAA